MKRGNISKKERRRAEVLHAVFSEFQPQIEAVSLNSLYPKMKRRLKGRSICFSMETCRRWYLRWRASPSPESLVRKWKAVNRPVSLQIVRKVESAALEQRISLCAAHKIVAAPVSYLTVLRHAGFKPEIRKLIRIEQARRRLAKAERDVIAKTTGGSTA